MVEDEWRNVVGYEGAYQVSNTGKVRSVDRLIGNRFVHGKILSDADSGKGYRYVNLRKNNKGKNLFVHRLVAQAFIPNKEGMPEVNHKDEDKANNCVGNLEWCGHVYNNNYGTKIERMMNSKGWQVTLRKFKHKNAIPKAVVATNKDGVIFKFSSIKLAAKELSIDASAIVKCCKGKAHTAKGFTFKYADGAISL